MDCIVHGVAKSQTQLRDFHLLLYLPRVLGGLNGRCIYMLGFPGGSDGKASAYNAGDVRDSFLIPGPGRSLGGGHGNLLQYFCLENPLDRGAWRAEVHRVTKSQTWLKPLSMPVWNVKSCVCVCVYSMLL